MPRWTPTRTGSASGRSSISAWASARAGMRWPPVPPPARRILTPLPIINAELGTRNAECTDQRRVARPRLSVPRSAFRVPRLLSFRVPPVPRSALSRPPTSPYGDQPARRDERHEQARAPVGNERQRDPRRRHDGETDPDVERRGERDQRGQPRGEELSEPVAGGPGDAEPQPRERGAGHQRQEHAHERPPPPDRTSCRLRE